MLTGFTIARNAPQRDNLSTLTGLPMSGDDEIVSYLRSLIEHSIQCRDEQCASCLAFRKVLESVRYRIFSGVFFPEVMIGRREPQSEAPAPNRRRAPERSGSPM